MEKGVIDAYKKMKDFLPGSSWHPGHITEGLPPDHADVVIVGGGVIGWSIAFWLKMKEPQRNAYRVVVVEKDIKVIYHLRSIMGVLGNGFKHQVC